MGWFGNSDKTAPPPGREVVANTGVKIDSDYIYYLGDDGNVWRKNDVSNVPIEMVAMAGVSKDAAYYYFIDTSGGNVCRIPVWYDMTNPDKRVDLNILHLEDIIDKAEMSSIAEGHEEAIIDTKSVIKTEIKGSVLNRSNVGGGSSKMQELKDLAEMKEKGLIDDDEFKQMKKEIIGK